MASLYGQNSMEEPDDVVVPASHLLRLYRPALEQALASVWRRPEVPEGVTARFSLLPRHAVANWTAAGVAGHAETGGG